MREFVCFHKPEEENGFLSNWHMSGFVFEGMEYCCMEQYMMHQKARLFEDVDIGASIMGETDPQRMQDLGRMVSGFDGRIWDGIRQIVVFRGLMEKFGQNAELREKLFATGSKILAECSVSDKNWGIGLSMHDKRRFDMKEWRGLNLLGFSLMEVRRILRWREDEGLI